MEKCNITVTFHVYYAQLNIWFFVPYEQKPPAFKQAADFLSQFCTGPGIIRGMSECPHTGIGTVIIDPCHGVAGRTTAELSGHHGVGDIRIIELSIIIAAGQIQGAVCQPLKDPDLHGGGGGISQSVPVKCHHFIHTVAIVIAGRDQPFGILIIVGSGLPNGIMRKVSVCSTIRQDE